MNSLCGCLPDEVLISPILEAFFLDIEFSSDSFGLLLFLFPFSSLTISSLFFWPVKFQVRNLLTVYCESFMRYESHFSSSFQILSVLLSFDSLIIICLYVDLFESILFGFLLVFGSPVFSSFEKDFNYYFEKEPVFPSLSLFLLQLL